MPPLGVSVRRALLDDELERVTTTLAGVVADLGGRRRARGRFAAPVARCRRWVRVNIEPREEPDVLADLAALPLRDACLDAVLCIETLQYVARPETAVAEMARVLMPNGQAIVSVPFLHRADAPTDRHRFTETRLRELAEGAALTVVRVVAQGAFFTVLANLLRQATGRIPARPLRYAAAAVVLPLAAALHRVDRLGVVRRSAFLASFTTGFLLVARKT